MLLRFALSDSALASACAQVIVADNISACSWETAMNYSLKRLFKWLG
jgi:hypothetical protein